MSALILAISVETLIGCAIIAAVPAHAPSIAIFILLFQNLFVSILSSFIANPSELEFIKGYNFLACSVMWLVTLGLYGLRWREYPAEVNRIMCWGGLVLATVLLYFLIGFLFTNMARGPTYLRNIVRPLVSAWASDRRHIRFGMTPFLVAIVESS